MHRHVQSGTPQARRVARPEGPSVNALAPAVTKTPTRKAMTERAREALVHAQAARRDGLHREGVTRAARALELATLAEQPSLRGMALSELALNEHRLGDSEQAAAHGREALPLLRRRQDAAARAQLLCTLVVAHNVMGLYAESLSFATEAIDSARLANDRSLLSWALNRAGLTYEELGDPQRGEPLLLQALEIAREIRGDEEMFSALNNLASNLLHLARLSGGAERDAAARRALVYGSEALALAERSGNPHREAVSLTNLADAHAMLGDADRAEPYIAREEQLATDHGFKTLLTGVQMNRAQLAQVRGDLPAAARLYEAVLGQVSRHEDAETVLQSHQALHGIYKALRQFELALHHLEQALPLERERLQLRADRRARLYLNRIEVENLQAAAERAQREAESQREKAARLESENQALADRAQELGRHALQDPLTGLANRRHFDAELPRLLQAVAPHGRAVSLAAIDLDHFKQVNDVHGHAVGDAVLRALGQLLAARTRSTDLVARLGGEEFIVVLADAPLAQAAALCERLRRAVEAHDWSAIAPGLRVTVSLGVVEARSGVAQAALLEQADQLLYAAKRRGRNRVETDPTGAPVAPVAPVAADPAAPGSSHDAAMGQALPA